MSFLSLHGRMEKNCKVGGSVPLLEATGTGWFGRFKFGKLFVFISAVDDLSSKWKVFLLKAFPYMPAKIQNFNHLSRPWPYSNTCNPFLGPCSNLYHPTKQVLPYIPVRKIRKKNRGEFLQFAMENSPPHLHLGEPKMLPSRNTERTSQALW